jgi:hypothetical protein
VVALIVADSGWVLVIVRVARPHLLGSGLSESFTGLEKSLASEVSASS